MKNSQRKIKELSKKFDKSLLKYPYRLKKFPFKGNKVYYMEKGTGKPVIFIHGLGEDSASWELNMDFLLNNRYKVIAIDLPGFGKSKGYENISITDMVQCVYELIRYLRLDKAVLIGHSMGGQVCADFAVRHSERIDKLILIASAGFKKYNPYFFQIYFYILESVFLNKKNIDYINKVNSLVHLNPVFKVRDLIMNEQDSYETRLNKAIKYTMRLTFFDKNQMANKLVMRRIKKLFHYGFKEQYNENKMGMKAMLEKKDLISSYDIKASTLLIWGTNDIMVPYRIAPEAKISIGSNAKLKSYSSCGHYPHIEKAQDFNETVLSFMENK